MKHLICLLIATCFMPLSNYAQQNQFSPDMTKAKDAGTWTPVNREISIKDQVIHLDDKNGMGLLWLNELQFTNGEIELDIKGKNQQGRSFLGIAFHGVNDSTFDAVYFRPFNFNNPDRKGHSVQYISLPGNDWFVLREKWPGKYENSSQPVPDPDNWFHIKVQVKHPVVSVFVNNNSTPSLVISQLSSNKTGRIALWTGNTSGGDFRNLRISNY
ncbi:family 16 glycoside hydrolase [Daejeonella sp.]|uniref:family 16 glycoside hydrolase n=1 Tax=Daejeonella sp. TaxID=2805397 RepID=UPI0030BBD4BB